jgi:hypothetical protein
MSDPSQGNIPSVSDPNTSPSSAVHPRPPPLQPAPSFPAAPTSTPPQTPVSSSVMMTYANPFPTITQTVSADSIQKKTKKNLPALQDVREFSRAPIQTPKSVAKPAFSPKTTMSEMLANIQSAINSSKAKATDSKSQPVNTTAKQDANTTPSQKQKHPAIVAKFTNLMKKRSIDKGKVPEGAASAPVPQRVIIASIIKYLNLFI